MKKQHYYYRVVDYRVIDGDTVDVLIDLGFNITVNKRIRFINIDTEEIRGGNAISKTRGFQAKKIVETFFKECDEITLETHMDSTGKYGRVLGEFHCRLGNDQLILSEVLLTFGLNKNGTSPKDFSDGNINQLFENYYSLEL